MECGLYPLRRGDPMDEPNGDSIRMMHAGRVARDTTAVSQAREQSTSATHLLFSFQTKTNGKSQRAPSVETVAESGEGYVCLYAALDVMDPR